jgi:AcrR family transcriptional regulator
MKLNHSQRQEKKTKDKSELSESETFSISDGRFNRSVVTRKKIVAALTSLVYEGYLSPTAEQVAQKADVGLRTVFRHFDDLNSLYSELSADLEALILPVLQIRLRGNSWQDKLMHSIEIRAQFYDRIAALYLSAQVHRHRSSLITDNLTRDVQRLREIGRIILPAVIQQNVLVFESLDLLMSPDTWVRLRSDQNLSSEEALHVVRLGVNAVLSAAE